MRCPGQNAQFWRPEDIKVLKCPVCGSEVEFWKDEVRRRCHHCGHDFINPEKNLGCALWCKLARECLGLTPDLWKEVEKLRTARNSKESEMKSMKTSTKRKIIQIDEEKCTGCGDCIISCAEGALRIIDGKAKLISDKYCDGLGACLGECPAGALQIVERDADEFDEEAVAEHLNTSGREKIEDKQSEKPAGQCPGAAALKLKLNREAPAGESQRGGPHLESWPVKIELSNSSNTFFKDRDLLVVSDCVPFAYRYFHEDLLKGRIPLCGCPKLNDRESYIRRLSEVFAKNRPQSITIARMEVPCCSGMTYVVKEALSRSGLDIPVKETVVKIDGTAEPSMVQKQG